MMHMAVFLLKHAYMLLLMHVHKLIIDCDSVIAIV